jgi:hypothetical protein
MSSSNEVDMARVEVRDSWVVDGDISAVRDALRTFVKITGFKVVEEQANEIRVKQGSQFLTRLLGGWFVSPTTLPKSATVSVCQAEDGVHIRALIEETMGFGILDPILADKYRAFFERWMDDLARVSEDATQRSERSGPPTRRPRDERTTDRRDDRLRRRRPDSGA